MPIFRCDYNIEGDLVFPSDETLIEIELKDDFKVSFKNGTEKKDGHTTFLIASIFGPASSIEASESELRIVLIEILSTLSFVTQSRYKIIEPIRAIEWDEGLVERHFRTFYTRDRRFPPSPELVEEYLISVQTIQNSETQRFTKTALRNFRYGLLEDSPEDQYMRFWLALEIIAENIKEKKSIPIFCASCGTKVKCTECDFEPTRIPMAKEAIQQLILNITGDKKGIISKRQFEARNGLIHGRSVASIEKKCKGSLSKIVNELATISWQAIMSTIQIADDKHIALSHWGGEFTNIHLVASMIGKFDHNGKGPHPLEESIPKVNISMKTRFGEPKG